MVDVYKRQGLDSVNISLDTLHPETFRRITGKDELAAVQNGIRAALALSLIHIWSLILVFDMVPPFFGFFRPLRFRMFQILFSGLALSDVYKRQGIRIRHRSGRHHR